MQHLLDCESLDNEENITAETHYGRDGCVITRRKKSKVIYSVGYNIDNDRENHFRELVMLYYPWRLESQLIGSCATFEDQYHSHKEIIESNLARYESMHSELFHCGNTDFEFDNDVTVSAQEQQENELDELEGDCISEHYKFFDPSGNATHSYDLGVDFGTSRKQIGTDESYVQGEMIDAEYRELVQSLNNTQKQFFTMFFHGTSPKPLYNFLTDGAGVGKSVLLKALYQALVKFYNHRFGENSDEMKFLVCAPTGKAAYNVGGMTIHSAFNIPAEQGFNFKPLDLKQLNSFQTRFQS